MGFKQETIITITCDMCNKDLSDLNAEFYKNTIDLMRGKYGKNHYKENYKTIYLCSDCYDKLEEIRRENLAKTKVVDKCNTCKHEDITIDCHIRQGYCADCPCGFCIHGCKTSVDNYEKRSEE